MVAVDLRGRSPEQFAAMIAAKLAGLVADKVAELAGEPWAGAEPAAGRPLAEVADPFALEVHRPVQPEEAQPELPELPAYVPREHDQLLARVVEAAAAGSSGVAVLVGGSSTGKTRACWETLALLRHQDPPWRLWHPIDPTWPDAALRELPTIGPRTVVWLNEAQFYLDVADGGLGERVAAGLRELLRDPARAPVLVLATLWPQYWHTLTARPPDGADPHAQARELLAGHEITVPAAFTAVQLDQLSKTGDPRLAQAAAVAQDGQVIQFLAGAPELLAWYRNAPPAAKALINAAMDARRLGIGVGLPRAFLEATAPGYLTDAEWDALGQDWLEQALAYTAVPCKGTRGPLTRIRPRPARSRAAGSGSRDGDDQPPAGQPGTDGGLVYRLADYLDQHGRAHRRDQMPPADFWTVAVGHASPADQATLGDAADHRGLYRAAAQLHKNAATSGSLRAAYYLSYPPPCLRGDTRPAYWAAAHAALDDPVGVARLLGKLREAGAHEQATALLDRDPAAQVALDDPVGVARLLGELREAGAHEQATALLDRDPAAQVALDDPVGVARLLGELREAGAPEQATALASRAAAQVTLDNPYTVARLLDRLREAGAHEQATALLDRDPAAQVALDDPVGVARLLGELREAGAHEQATALLDRDPAAQVALDDPDRVAELLYTLREAGAPEQATALASRAAAQVTLDNPYTVARLLDRLREAGAHEQATALLDRDPAAQVALDDPEDVAELLGELREAGAHEQATALLDREPAAQVALDDPLGVAELLGELREAGAHEQATALASRAAAHATLDDPVGVALLLGELREAGAPEQATALLDRDPAAQVALDNPYTVALLLGELREAGAPEQATALAARLPAAGMFGLFLEQHGRTDQFRFGREADGSPSAPWGWEDLDLCSAPPSRRSRKGGAAPP